MAVVTGTAEILLSQVYMYDSTKIACRLFLVYALEVCLPLAILATALNTQLLAFGSNKVAPLRGTGLGRSYE